MPIVLRITTAGTIQSSTKRLRKIHKNMQELPLKVMMRWGKILERDMKLSARKANIKEFTGTLFGPGIQYRQRPKGKTGMLFIRQYGVQLDSMNPHVVSVHRRRSRLLAWALQAQKTNISKRARLVQKGKLKNFPIYVKPHPFIHAGWNRARRKLKPLLIQESKQALGG